MANSSIRNLNIDGNLVISGSTTQLDVVTLTADSNVVKINDIEVHVTGSSNPYTLVAGPTDANANQGGLTLTGGSFNTATGVHTPQLKTILFVTANDAWTSSEHLDIANTKEYRINNVSVLNATTLGSSVINSSLTSVGTLGDLTVGGVKITGASNNIGLLTDTNLITLANNTVTVAGAVHATTLHGDGNALTNLNTASFSAPGSNGQIIINSSGALGAITTVPLAQGGTGGTDAATARTSLGVTATGADTAYNYRSNNLSDVASSPTARTNLGLGTGDSPTFGHTAGHGAVTVEAFPDGATLKTSGLLQRSIPPAAGSGHRFFTGIGDGIGSYLISHKVTSDAGVDSGTAAVYLYTRDTGKKVYIGGTYPAATTTNAYINDLAYPTADGSAGQVIKTDGAGALTFTSVSSLGGLLAANNLSDVASAATARTNLGLGTAALQNTGVFAQVANNLSDVTAATARTNLGLGTIALQADNAVNIDGGAIDGTAIGATTPAAGSFTTINASTSITGALVGAVTGNASTATALQTPRTISGVSFNGTANITLNTSAITENTNLYYTDARADARIAAATTTDLTEGTNLYFTNARADARIWAFMIDEDDMVSNSAVKQPTQQSVKAYVDGQDHFSNADFDTRLATKTTANLAEGADLYYTNARADARIALANINDLVDVTGSPNHGDVLYWDNATTNWRPATHEAVILADTVDKTHIDWGVGANQVNTSQIPENTNLFYTTARWDTKMAAADTGDLAEGADLYYTDARAQAVSINNVVEDTTPQLGGTLDANGNVIDMGSNNITDAKVGQWDTAYADTNAASEADSNSTLVKRGATGNVALSKVTANNGVVLGNNTGTTAGTVRWSGTDFQGYDGSNWVSLTSAATAQISGQIATFSTTQSTSSSTYSDVPGYTTAITVTSSDIINCQVTVDVGNDDLIGRHFIQLVRVIAATETVLHTEEVKPKASSDRTGFNLSFADAHGQSNGTVITYKLKFKANSGTVVINPNFASLGTTGQIFLYELTTTPTSVTSVWGQTGDIVSADWGSVA